LGVAVENTPEKSGQAKRQRRESDSVCLCEMRDQSSKRELIKITFINLRSKINGYKFQTFLIVSVKKLKSRRRLVLSPPALYKLQIIGGFLSGASLVKTPSDNVVKAPVWVLCEMGRPTAEEDG
jgi:hypothetical protein